MFSSVQTYLANTIKVNLSRALLSLAKVGVVEPFRIRKGHSACAERGR